MAQHVLLEGFQNKRIQAIAQAIRRQRYFKTSLRYESLSDEYKETPTDEVYITWRSVPKSILLNERATLEVHTEPHKRGGRLVTNIYLVA